MPPRDLDQLVEALTDDMAKYENGMGRAADVTERVVARLAWKGAPPLTHGEDYVTITHHFDGTEREFGVAPKDAGVFEFCLPGQSAYACLQRFVDNSWTVDDVVAVLSLALYGPPPNARQAYRLARSALASGFMSAAPSHYTPHPGVVEAVQRDGPANFASLAAEILTSVLFREAPAPEAEVADAA